MTDISYIYSTFEYSAANKYKRSEIAQFIPKRQFDSICHFEKNTELRRVTKCSLPRMTEIFLGGSAINFHTTLLKLVDSIGDIGSEKQNIFTPFYSLNCLDFFSSLGHILMVGKWEKFSSRPTLLFSPFWLYFQILSIPLFLWLPISFSPDLGFLKRAHENIFVHFPQLLLLFLTAKL